MTWASALLALFKAVADYLLGRAAQKDAAAALKDLGASESALSTNEIIAEKADAQAEVEAARRGGAADVAHRLRDEARAARARASKGGG